MTSQSTKPSESPSDSQKPPRKLIRFHFPRGATAKEIAEALARLKAQHSKGTGP